MARIPKPWFREQTRSWYVKIDGVQHPLGRDKKEADRQFHRLMAGEGLSVVQAALSLVGLIRTSHQPVQASGSPSATCFISIRHQAGPLVETKLKIRHLHPASFGSKGLSTTPQGHKSTIEKLGKNDVLQKSQECYRLL